MPKRSGGHDHEELKGLQRWTKDTAWSIPVGRILGMRVTVFVSDPKRVLKCRIVGVFSNAASVQLERKTERLRVMWGSIYTPPLKADGSELRNLGLFVGGRDLLVCRFCEHETPICEIREGAGEFKCPCCKTPVYVPTASMPWNSPEIPGGSRGGVR